MPVNYGPRQTTLDEKRARARQKVAVAARDGERPSDYYSPEDLAWAFRGHEDELAELEQLAPQAIAAAREKHLRRQRNTELRAMADRIEKEMLAAETAARRAEAEQEARRRLGLDHQEED